MRWRRCITNTSENKFIEKVKSLSGWRWGGDFTNPDRIHIDKKGNDYSTIRDDNQKQMDGDTSKEIDKTRILRNESINLKKKT